jgi:hypothetical protein
MFLLATRPRHERRTRERGRTEDNTTGDEDEVGDGGEAVHLEPEVGVKVVLVKDSVGRDTAVASDGGETKATSDVNRSGEVNRLDFAVVVGASPLTESEVDTTERTYQRCEGGGERGNWTDLMSAN